MADYKVGSAEYEAIELLKKYVSYPSGSNDIDDVVVLADVIASDLRALGVDVKLHTGLGLGPIIEGTYGSGPNKIMLMGHMDTVFPRADYRPFRIEGDKAYGSGVMDMKGGLVIMNRAFKAVAPTIDMSKYTVKIIINPDEELGSPTSHELIYTTAKGAKACLSFEPQRPNGGLVCERKGVTSVKLTCTGVRGHAGAAYKTCRSAIQEICARITELYTLRDDDRDISINVGTVKGGTAENVVADYAEAQLEYRYFDMAYKAEIEEKIKEICAKPGVDGCATTVEFGASHPSAKMTPESQKLFDTAAAIAADLGGSVYHEKTGGAGDISIAAVAGAPVLDGLGLQGVGAHSHGEYAMLETLPFCLKLATRMLEAVTR